MADLLAGLYFGLESKEEGSARCAVPDGGFDECLMSDSNELAGAAVGGGKVRTRKTAGRNSRWLTSCLALAGPYFELVWLRVL
jgi:hypothetical protein